MKAMTLFDTVGITISTDTTVDEHGEITTTTIASSHGNAVHTSLGQLHGEGRQWWVTARDSDLTMLVRLTKRGAVEAFANRATAQAAQWAAHKETV